jgi:hypothetical protein
LWLELVEAPEKEPVPIQPAKPRRQQAALQAPPGIVRPALHFVGFRGDEHTTAVRIWGAPDFYHPRWDVRASLEIHETDTVVFAKGSERDEPSKFNAQDIIEDEP